MTVRDLRFSALVGRRGRCRTQMNETRIETTSGRTRPGQKEAALRAECEDRPSELVSAVEGGDHLTERTDCMLVYRAHDQNRFVDSRGGKIRESAADRCG